MKETDRWESVREELNKLGAERKREKREKPTRKGVSALVSPCPQQRRTGLCPEIRLVCGAV